MPLLNKLDDDLAMLDTDEETIRLIIRETGGRLRVIKALLEEHDRCQELVGKRPLGDAALEAMRQKEKNHPLLLHICASTPSAMVAGRRAILELRAYPLTEPFGCKHS